MIPGNSDKPLSETTRTNCVVDSNRGGNSSGYTAEKVTSNRIDSINGKRLASNHGSVKILGSVRNKTTGNIDILDNADIKDDGNNDNGVKAEAIVNNTKKKEWSSVLLRSRRCCHLSRAYC